VSRFAKGAGLMLAALLCCVSAASAAIPAWTTYRHDSARSGIDPDSTSPLPPVKTWQSTALDGKIYGEPLVYGSRVYVATENDTVYSLDAATGQIMWEQHLGTAVASSQLPCGNISPVVGITSTPVIDPATKTIYAVMDTWDGTHPESIRHELLALDLGTGAPRPGFPIRADPPFPEGGGGSAAQQLQRTALALDGNEVVIGYGGNDGDCGSYWGWLVAAPESGSGPLLSYQVDSKAGHHEGAIWGAGNAPPVDSGGDIYTATGNGSSGSEYDYGDSVLELNPNLQLLANWAPADWQSLDESDADLGSSDPVLLPDGFLFEIGKQGVSFLLRSEALGGVGGAPTAELAICSGSWGGGIYVPASASSGTLYVTCADGLRAISVTALGGAEPKLSMAPSWKVNANAVGPPIFAGGLVWVASYEGKPGNLYGLDPSTGAATFESKLGTFMHFSTPSAAGGRLFAANGTQVTAFTIATAPAPSPTTTALASTPDPASVGQPVTLVATVNPVPDGGAVRFTDAGVTIAGCGTVDVNPATGQATCQTTYAAGGPHPTVAAYAGDAYYAASASSPLEQLVNSAPEAGPLPLGPASGPSPSGPSVAVPLTVGVAVSDLRQSHASWHEGNQVARISMRRAEIRARPPVGTTFSFSLTEQAAVTFRFTRQLAGRRVGRKCRATDEGNRTYPRCERTVAAGTLSFTGHGGANDVVFQGRISRSKKLDVGRYALIVNARNATGTSTPLSVVFTILS